MSIYMHTLLQKAREGSVFEEEAIKKQRKISEATFVEQLTRGFFEVKA